MAFSLAAAPRDPAASDNITRNHSRSTYRRSAADFAGESAVRPKNRRKFSAVADATSSAAKFLTLASAFATSPTYAGSLRLPRYGCGARYGASVSIKRFSSGKAFATSRRFCAFGYVEFPAKDIRKPIASPLLASSRVLVKQCQLPPSPVCRQLLSSISRQSAHASRQ